MIKCCFKRPPNPILIIQALQYHFLMRSVGNYICSTPGGRAKTCKQIGKRTVASSVGTLQLGSWLPDTPLPNLTPTTPFQSLTGGERGRYTPCIATAKWVVRFISNYEGGDLRITRETCSRPDSLWLCQGSMLFPFAEMSLVLFFPRWFYKRFYHYLMCCSFLPGERI